jgi:hypothetical protein
MRTGERKSESPVVAGDLNLWAEIRAPRTASVEGPKWGGHPGGERPARHRASRQADGAMTTGVWPGRTVAVTVVPGGTRSRWERIAWTREPLASSTV